MIVQSIVNYGNVPISQHLSALCGQLSLADTGWCEMFGRAALSRRRPSCTHTLYSQRHTQILNPPSALEARDENALLIPSGR